MGMGTNRERLVDGEKTRTSAAAAAAAAMMVVVVVVVVVQGQPVHRDSS